MRLILFTCMIVNALNLDAQAQPSTTDQPDHRTPAERQFNKRTGNAALVRKDILLLNFRAGVSQPLGDFASQDLNSLESGLALQGYMLEASATIKLARILGFSAQFRSQFNRFNSFELQTVFELTNPGTRPDFSARNWQNRGLLFGLHFDIPLSYIPRLSLIADLMAGVPKHYYPDLTANYTYSSVPVTVLQKAPPVRAVTMAPALGFSYKLDETVAVTVSCEYLTAEPRFTVTTSARSQVISYGPYKQHVETINIKAGMTLIVREKPRPFPKAGT